MYWSPSPSRHVSVTSNTVGRGTQQSARDSGAAGIEGGVLGEGGVLMRGQVLTRGGLSQWELSSGAGEGASSEDCGPSLGRCPREREL